jgi:anti-sigma factor RsiW
MVTRVDSFRGVLQRLAFAVPVAQAEAAAIGKLPSALAPPKAAAQLSHFPSGPRQSLVSHFILANEAQH